MEGNKKILQCITLLLHLRLLKLSNLNGENKLKTETIQSSPLGIIETAGTRACIDRVVSS